MKKGLGRKSESFSLSPASVEFSPIKRRIKIKSTTVISERLKKMVELKTSSKKRFSEWFDSSLSEFLDEEDDVLFHLEASCESFTQINELKGDPCNISINLECDTYKLLQTKALFCILEYNMVHDDAQRHVLHLFINAAIGESSIYFRT